MMATPRDGTWFPVRLVLAVGASCGCIATAAAAISSTLTSSQKEEPLMVPWKPTPSFLSQTEGHKTMYLADVAIGSQGQIFRVLVDTGSSVLVVPSATCKSPSCGKHKRLNTSASTSSRATGRTLAIGYGLGSLKGHVFEDEVCVPRGPVKGVAGAAAVAAPLEELDLLQRKDSHHVLHSGRAGPGTRAFSGSEGGSERSACTRMSFLANDEESDDLNRPFDGILGLGPEDPLLGGTGAFSLLARLAAVGSTSSTSFVLRLSNLGRSELLLGGFDEASLAGGRALWVPLSPRAAGNWQFHVQDLMLDGKMQGFGEMEVVVDSGTSLLGADANLQIWLQEHLQPSSCASVDQLPKLGFRLPGGEVLSLLPDDYIDQIEGECNLALMPTPFRAVNSQRLILGDSFLRRFVTIFDREGGRRLGFGIAVDDDDGVCEILTGMFPLSVAVAKIAAPRCSGRDRDRQGLGRVKH
eukprot:gnl/TRDRNA2_/TRDRNA2_160355_c3_seq1.p1 gnl/TRDRNA2_/TRDRNA2_160355_c3~~gnl/TRDRNA2_/TRDRNA2_160355_c3_seq1.p1  ORF type:complete len:468 (+),score=82.79 gnl/TRDRNA2_/TRDRNA2_160355_c3_seq1:26-1429(+)